MWLFTAVSLAICTPCVRSALEALFAELTIVFFNHVALVALATALAFVAALLLRHTLALKQQERAARHENTGKENTRNDTSSPHQAIVIGIETLRVWWYMDLQLGSRSSASRFRAKNAVPTGNNVRDFLLSVSDNKYSANLNLTCCYLALCIAPDDALLCVRNAANCVLRLW